MTDLNSRDTYPTKSIEQTIGSHFSAKAFHGFLKFNHLLERELTHKLRISPFYSIIVDESMDAARKENLVIYFKFLDIETALF